MGCRGSRGCLGFCWGVQFERGWLLGLLSPIVSDGIKKRLKKKELQESFLNDLNDLRGRLIANASLIIMKFGNLNREMLEWIQSNKHFIQEYKPGAFERINSLLELDDRKLAELNRIQKNLGSDALFLPLLKLPFIDSNINYLSIFDTKYQKQILDIRSQLHFLNEQIEQTRYYFKMTFDSDIKGDNYEIISKNLINSYLEISIISKLIITKIENFSNQ